MVKQTCVVSTGTIAFVSKKSIAHELVKIPLSTGYHSQQRVSSSHTPTAIQELIAGRKQLYHLMRNVSAAVESDLEADEADD